jgi:trehalose synthase
MKLLEDYQGIVEDEILADLHRRAARLLDKHVVNMNSTAYGGGVAELLASVVPLMNDAGLNAGWRVLVGQHDFFDVTKKFHNALQGGEISLGNDEKRMYLETNESFSQYTHISEHDCIIIHDPQPLPIIRYYRKRQPWIWRCHIDLSNPNPELWSYLKGFILRYDMMIVSHESYLREDLPVEQRIIHPAIDPLAQKNIELDDERVASLLERHGIPTDKPLVTQVSRFDPWKDQEGLVRAFRRVLDKTECRLVLAGNVASDDPESTDVYENVRAGAADLIERGDVVIMLGASDIAINALQRASAVCVQKSLKEGFGLTVAEALWKGTPMIAGLVGGIPLQLIEGEGGYLVDPYDDEEVAERIIELVEDPDKAARMGAAGREHIRKDFLVTRLLGHWLALLDEVIWR